jgi:hypothetical protein
VSRGRVSTAAEATVDHCCHVSRVETKWTIKGVGLPTDSLTSIGFDLRKLQTGSYTGANSACIVRVVDMARASTQESKVSLLIDGSFMLMSMDMEG